MIIFELQLTGQWKTKKSQTIQTEKSRETIMIDCKKKHHFVLNLL